VKIVAIQRADVGGAAWRHERILTRQLGCAFTRYQQYSLALGFPRGLEWNEPAMLDDCATADVIHLHTTSVVALWLPRLRAMFPGKRIAATYHGIESLNAPFPQAYEVPHVYVSPNMASVFPNGRFIPNFVDPEDEALVFVPPERKSAPLEHPLLCCSRSYVAGYKDWGVRDQLVRQGKLQTDFPVEFVPHHLWMTRVGQAHFVWDHFQGYWGQTVVEGFWLGTIPIVRVDARGRQAALDFFDAAPPFGPDSVEEWSRFIARFASDPGFAEAEAAARYRFVTTYWTPRRAAQVWEAFYASLL